MFCSEKINKRNIARIIVLILIVFFNYLPNLFSKGSSGENAKFESLYIVNSPTAGIVPKYSFSIYSNIFENSGIYTEINASPFTNFSLGMSYGGSNIIGGGEIEWQNLPGVQIRIRLFDESLKIPAILIGFNSQGRGTYYPNLKRFQNLSQGFFLTVSKSYTWKLGNLVFHGGINYSIEPIPNDRVLNYYAGIEQSIGNRGSVNLEYNAALDEKPGMVINKRGLLNLAIRYAFTQNMTIEIQFIDLFKHTIGSQGALRRIGIEYIDNF